MTEPITWKDLEGREKIGPKELAELLGVHQQTVLRWRRQQQGPPPYKEAGKVWYYVEDLIAWRDRAKWAWGRYSSRPFEPSCEIEAGIMVRGVELGEIKS